MGAAHGAVVAFVAQMLGGVVLERFFGVERQVKLVSPPEVEARLAQRVVPHLRARVAFGEVGGVGCDFVGHYAGAHVLLVGQAQVLLWRNVAYHGGAVAGYLRRADGRGDVVVAGGNVGGQGAERVEGCAVAALQLLVHVGLYLVQGDVPRPLYEHLHVVRPRRLGQLAQRRKLGKLRRVVGVADAAGAKPVAQRYRSVVLPQDVAYLLKAGVEEVFLAPLRHPSGNDGAAAGHDAGQPPLHQGQVRAQQACVNGEVVHPLLALLDERVAVNLPAERRDVAVHLFQRLVDGHRPHRHGRVADNPLPRFVDIFAGGQVHQRVAAPLAAPHGLFHLLVHAGRKRRAADVRVDFHQKAGADNHRLGLGVVDVGGYHRAPGGDFAADKFGRDVGGYAQRLALLVFADGGVLHFGGDDALPGVVHLRNALPRFCPAREVDARKARGADTCVREALAAVGGRKGGQRLGIAPVRYPRLAQARKALPDVYRGAAVGVGAAGVVNGNGRVLFLPLLPVFDRNGVQEGYLAHPHADVVYFAFLVDFPGSRIGNLHGAVFHELWVFAG